MRKKLSIWFLLALVAIALYLSYLVLSSFLSPILTAVVMGIAFFPFYSWIHSRVRKPVRAAALTILVIVLAVLIPATVVGINALMELRGIIDSVKQHSVESGGFSQYVQSLMDHAMAFAGKYVDVSGIDTKEQLVNFLQRVRGPLLAGAGAMAGNLASMALTTVLVLFLMGFIFAEGREIKERCARLMPLERGAVDRLFDGVRDTIQASMLGMVVVALAQAVLLGLGLWALGVPGPFLWGTVAAFASLVPVVGTAIIWIPAVIWLFAAGFWIKALILLAWSAGAVGTVDNILRPYVMSGKVEMHPLLLLFSIIGGVDAFGMIGLFAGPVILAVTQTLFEILGEEMRSAGILD
jgi:predicted PurR-regulated permease PerM